MGNRIVETRRFGARASNERAAQRFLSDVLNLTSMPLKTRNDVRLAVEELFNNVSSYAYGPGGGFLDLTVSVDDAASTVSILISDEGRAFDPFAEDRHNTTGDPALDDPAQKRRGPGRRRARDPRDGRLGIQRARTQPKTPHRRRSDVGRGRPYDAGFAVPASTRTECSGVIVIDWKRCSMYASSKFFA